MHVRLFKPTGPDRVAFVAQLPADDGNGLLVQVAKGPSAKKLRDPKLFGPMTQALADEVFGRELATLRGEGFARSGLGELLLALDSKKRKKRALAARRLGWLHERSAVEPLLALAAKANEELPVVIDALGDIGDPLAIPVARAAAERKLLSRRRSGVEALRKLSDLEGLSDARTRALERIPENVRTVLSAIDAGTSDAAALVAAIAEVPIKDRGLAIDSLYELGLDATVAAARGALLDAEHTSLEAPHIWRYTKSVFKRAMLRSDFPTFGALAHAIERRVGKTPGATATVKSGLDGETKQLKIFARGTQLYMARLSWRHLRMLGRYRPDSYAAAAAEVLVRYSMQDADDPQGHYGSFARAYLLGRILYGGSNRFVIHHASLRWRLKSSMPGTREASFFDCWERAPLAYVRVLSAAKLVMLHEWALPAVTKRHMAALYAAPATLVVDMLDAPHEPTVALGLDELRRRFDPAKPDWDLLTALAHATRESVRDLGLDWLAQTRALWALFPARVLRFMGGADGTTRAAIVGHVTDALVGAAPEVRRAMAAAFWDLVRKPEKSEGEHDSYAAILRVLANEVAAITKPEELLAMLGAASAGARAAAGIALAVHPDVDRLIGPNELAVLTNHPQAALREAARAVLRRRKEALKRDASPLFDLLDSEWPDMRAFAADFVERELASATLGLDTLLGILDSTYVDVQDLGKKLVAARLASLPTAELLNKLLEHPHPSMRRYVLDLVIAHLKDGFIALASTEAFFRTIFLDVTPDRSLKRDAIAFLERRGLSDPRQAEIAIHLLAEVVRSKTVFDFELALGALAKLKLAAATEDITESTPPIVVPVDREEPTS